MFRKISFFLLRVGMGGLFFYSGITKILDPEWSAAGYLAGAKTFMPIYQWLAGAGNIGWVNFLNEWGLTLIGASLILGLFVRLSSIAGILIMLLYYFPILQFPHVSAHAYIVNEHIIYALVFFSFITFRAGNFWGVDGMRKP